MRIPLEFSIRRDISDEAKVNLWLLIGFLLSFLHVAVCGIFFAALLLLMKRGAAGCVKAIFILIARTTIISTVIAVDVSGLSILKWVLVFILSADIAFLNKVQGDEERRIMQTIGLLLSAYVLYIVVTALITSSYPVVSIFKSVSYAFVFFAVLKGIAISHSTTDWIRFLHAVFSAFLIISFVTMPIMSLRYINIEYFQGIGNHPNNFAIYAAAYIVLLLNSMEKCPKFNIVMILLTVFMIYISRSRTAMFTSVAMFALYLIRLFRYRQKTALYTTAVIASALLVLFALFSDEITGIVEGFVYKGSNELLFSRNIQIELFNERFSTNPYLGTGFMVPFIPGVKDFSFSFDLFVEHGNILFAVLGDTGIAGTLLFILLYGYILISGYKKRILFFVFPVIISSGEMVFFSTNSMGVLFYIFFGIFVFSETVNRDRGKHPLTGHEASDEKMLTVRV